METGTRTRGWAGVVVLALGLVAITAGGCVKTRIVRGYTVKQDFPPPAHTGSTELRHVRRVAVMPFQNTAQFAHSMDVNLAYANQQIASALVRVRQETGVAIEGPNSTQSTMSESGMTQTYAQLWRDYKDTGLIDVQAMRTIAREIKADLVIQGVLIDYKVDTEEELFKSALMHWFVFDGKTGRIDWNVRIKADQKVDFYQHQETDKTLAHVYTGLTGLLFLGGTGMMLGSLGDEELNTGLLIGGSVMMLPFCFAPAAYLPPSEAEVVTIKPDRELLDLEQALSRMIRDGLERISKQLRAG